MIFFARITLVACFLGMVIDCNAKGSDSIEMADVKTITLRRGEYTTARRVDPLPQVAP